MKLNARKLIVNSYEQKVACRAILAEYKFLKKLRKLINIYES